MTIKNFLAASTLALLTLTTWSAAQAETQILDSVVAIVEDDVVMASELRARIQLVTQNLTAAGQEMPDQENLVRETLDRLILESIQLQMGRRAGVRISDAQLSTALNKMAAQNRMSLDQFRQQIEKDGKSYRQLRDDIQRELILQRVQAGNVNQRIQISEQEAENFLESEEGQSITSEQYHLVHAALTNPEGATDRQIDAARDYVNGLYQRIQSGESFESVINTRNENYVFSGGDLGWHPASELPSIFAEVAPKMAIGETATPVESDSGFHIIYLAEKRGGQTIVPQTHVRHILIKPSAIRDHGQILVFIKKLRQQIIEGADFADVARDNSEDIGSAQEGGDLSWASPGQMVPEFEAAMNVAEIGEITEPVQSQFGWHILEVLERREQDMTDIVAMNRARDVLHQSKYQEELQAWLRKIRDEAFVDIK